MSVKSKALVCFCCIFGTAFAQIPNVAFGERENQLSLHLGQSGRNYMEDFFLIGFSYSQPNRFFRLPGRINVEFMTHRGLGTLSRYNQDMVFGFSQDVVLPVFWRWGQHFSRMYLGINLGIYIESEITDRIGSKFTFGERAFLGYRIIDALALELYYRHFSNGDLTAINSGQDLIGLSVMWNF